jgi:aminoglycoside phosphotransferase (APT) family kinase protein
VAPAGINQPNVTAWFAEHVEDVREPLAFSLIAGGRSNPTFEVSDADGRRWILRRPPLSHVLPSAHDMSREFRIIKALGSTDVPVPIVVGLCTDETVNQAPFYVMEFVEGHILRRDDEVERAFDPGRRDVLGLSLADTLATLHAVDPDEIGLGDLARKEGYIGRQLRRWSQQFRDTIDGANDYDEDVERLAAELGQRIPDQVHSTIVHGDYRLDNTVVTDAGSIRAVLDWELCTLGDPLADVGQLLVYWVDGPTALSATASAAPGMASPESILERYADQSARDVSSVPFYQAFAQWKLGCILQGVYHRYRSGAGSGDEGSVEAYPEIIGWLMKRSAQTLAAW